MVAFSFICPSNREDLVELNIKHSLTLQKFSDYELIVVGADEGKFKSAAEALNFGAKNAKGEYLVFLHHDVSFEDPEFLTELHNFVTRNSFLIAGIAGCVQGDSQWRKWTYTNIVHGANKSKPYRSSEISEVMSCDTLDECFFVIPQSVWRARPLSVFAPGWHLYAVEYSLWANLKEKGSCKVFPLTLWHHSDGASFDENYYRMLTVLRKNYADFFSFLYTPMGAWPTAPFAFRLRIVVNRIKRLVDRMYSFLYRFRK